MKRVLKRIYYYYFFIIFAFIFLLCFPFAYFLLRNPKYHKQAHKMRRYWARVILFAAGIRYEVMGAKDFDLNQTFVYTSNHTSPLDILAILAVFPGYYGFLGKVEMLDIPIFGYFFKTIDLTVDRSSREKSASSYKRSIETLRSQKGLVIFPEGGILGKVPVLQPFKDGPFDLAIRNKVPILPFTFPDNWKRVPDDGSKFGKPGKIRIILHKPLETANFGKEDVGKLRDVVFDLIQRDLEKYNC